LYDNIRLRAAETSDLVLHAIKGDVIGKTDLTSWSRDKTGFGYLRIRRTSLMDVFYDAVRLANIPIHFGKRLVGIAENSKGVTATFDDGTSDTADFLLGCDGIHSAVRKLYVDPDMSPEYSGVVNVFSLLETATLPPAAASLDGLNATLTTDGLLALCPCTATNEMIYWFFSRQIPMPPGGGGRDGWEERGKREVESLKGTLLDLLKETSGEWGDLWKAIIARTDVVKFYPIFRMVLGGRWARGRCLILGDAAHAMQPHASQGVSMALEDVFLLSKLLEIPGRSLDEIYAVYEQKRRPRTDEMSRTAERNGNVRKKTDPWRLWLQECAISGMMSVYNFCKLDRLGIGQKVLAYDVEDEEV
jgi:2-polyprenyl-6-methoxyphenol hydroxylase-like FAD-dependent oxidoreductase